MDPSRILIVLILFASGVVGAQGTTTTRSDTTPANRPAPPGNLPATSSEEVPPSKSPFAGYRPFSDEPLSPWRSANDTVHRIGGWQAYGREAQRDLRPPPAPGPASGTDRSAPATTGDLRAPVLPPMAPAAKPPGARP